MYRLNDEQQRIAATAAAVADRDLAPRAASVDRDGGVSEGLDRRARRQRPPRPDRAEGARRARTGSADGGRRHRRARAALPVDRDGLPDAPVRHRLLRRRAGQDGAAARGRRRRAPPLDARLQREGIAQPLLGAGQPRDGAGNGAVRSARRSRSSPRPATPTATSSRRWRPARRSRSRAPSTSSSKTTRAWRCRDRGAGWACAATPARR